ncbi:MAG: response regulator transcription factor, partial [Phycisphaerae bacterium]
MFVCLMIETRELSADLKVILTDHGIDTASSNSIFDAEYVLRGRKPDLMLIQQSRSWFGGGHLLGVLRDHPLFREVPIVVVGAADEVMEVVALTLGADEYVTWPCSPDILMARLRSIMRLRKPKRASGDAVSLGPVTIDIKACVVLKEGHTLSLNQAEFVLLKNIVSNGGMVTRR